MQESHPEGIYPKSQTTWKHYVTRGRQDCLVPPGKEERRGKVARSDFYEHMKHCECEIGERILQAKEPEDKDK